jgi:hypothetical protein
VKNRVEKNTEACYVHGVIIRQCRCAHFYLEETGMLHDGGVGVGGDLDFLKGAEDPFVRNCITGLNIYTFFTSL